jgi:hypothetical protein
MRILDFNKTPSAETLNENAGKAFGQKLDLSKFNLEQLEDTRNHIRTKLSQIENSSSFNAVYEDESYAKNKAFVEILTRAIDERREQVSDLTQMEQMVLQKVEEGSISFEELPEELQAKVNAKNEGTVAGAVAAAAKAGNKVGMQAAMDDDESEEDDETEASEENKLEKKYGKADESILREGEEEKAELIMAARDMVDRVTGWMEDTANMQAESMLELVDSIRDELGSDTSMEFESVVKPALAAIYTTMETSRQQLTQGVGILTGEAEPTEPMGAEAPAEAPEGETVVGGEEEAAASAPAAGGAEEAGRAVRESVAYSRKLASLLAPK